MGHTATRNNKSKRKTSPLPLILAGSGLILIAFAVAIFGGQPDETTGPTEITSNPSAIPAAVNYSAPKLNLSSVTGDSVSLSDYRGQVILVNNWATWCPPCRAEMPELLAYYEAHKDDSFTLIGVSAGDTRAQVEDFIGEYGITFPMWLDPESASLRAFKTDYLPSSFVIDASGTVRLAWTGAISLERLEDYVTPLLEN